MFSMRACVNQFYKYETHNMGGGGDGFELLVIFLALRPQEMSEIFCVFFCIVHL